MLLPPELLEEEKKILETLMAGGHIEHFETVRVTKTGKRINVSLTISPIKDSSGRTIGCSGIARDITERKRAGEALRASEERLRLAQWAARIGTFDLNLQTGVDIWTPEMEALYGLPPGGFGGTLTAFENLVHPDDRKRIIALSEVMMRTGQPVEAEWRVVWPDGSVRWIAGRGQVLMDESGEPSRMIGVNMDITETKRAEQALHETNRALEEQSALLQSREELLRTFVKNVPAAVAMLDREMRYLQVSERWCTDYLPGRTQVLGRSHYEVFPDMPERWKEVHRRALQGETLRADEDRWDGQDGAHWARWEVRPWTTPEGIVGGILILTEDITRRKQMEEALSELSRKLINSQEQDRSRIGRDLHDDISQQLALLAVGIEQLRQRPLDSVEISNGLTEIRDRVHAIAADVQSLSHQLHPPQLQILGIVAAIRGFCREFAAHQKVTVDFTHDNVPKGVSHDVSLCLFRLVQEALHNAVKHSNVRQYHVRLGYSASELHLTVSDRGTGFNSEAAMSGGGLGLVSMRERVRLVNGTIVIKSTPMGGTIVDVRVPAVFESYPQPSAS
jgi:PAS domain S-box-containing protein